MSWLEAAQSGTGGLRYSFTRMICQLNQSNRDWNLSQVIDPFFPCVFDASATLMPTLEGDQANTPPF